MKHQQVSKQSGMHFRFNLDDLTYVSLAACHQAHRDHNNHYSSSVIVRRALRLYRQHLAGLDSRRMELEVTEIMRAKKGLL